MISDIQQDYPAQATSDITEEELQVIYNWIDSIPLSRPKRNISRDFSDGCLCAEVVKHYIPKLVDLHNYSQAHSVAQKVYNWNTLNLKVLKKFGFSISKQEIDALVQMVPDAVERLLLNLKTHLENLPSRLPITGISKQGQSGPLYQGDRTSGVSLQSQMIDGEALLEKEHTIGQLKETIEILELKVKKLEQLVKLKDSKIANLSGKLQSMGIIH